MIELLRQNIRLVAVISVVVALLVGILVLFLQWQSAEDEQTKLERDWNSAKGRLGAISVQYDLDTLQAQKDELSAKPQFPSKLPIADLILYVADGMRSFSVNITEIKPDARASTETIGGNKYPASKTQVTVTGTLAKITSFLKYIERGSFNSIKIEDVSLSGSGDKWQGKFTIVVITQN